MSFTKQLYKRAEIENIVIRHGKMSANMGRPHRNLYVTLEFSEWPLDHFKIIRLAYSESIT